MVPHEDKLIKRSDIEAGAEFKQCTEDACHGVIYKVYTSPNTFVLGPKGEMHSYSNWSEPKTRQEMVDALNNISGGDGCKWEKVG